MKLAAKPLVPFTQIAIRQLPVQYLIISIQCTEGVTGHSSLQT